MTLIQENNIVAITIIVDIKMNKAIKEKRYNHTFALTNKEFELIQLLSKKKEISQGKLIGKVIKEKASQLKLNGE